MCWDTQVCGVMLSKPQSQEEEQGSTWRRDQLHLEGADGSQEASNDSKEFGEEEEDLADGGPGTIGVANSGRKAGCCGPDRPSQGRRQVPAADEGVQRCWVTPRSSPSKARDRARRASWAPTALARLPPAGKGLPRWKNLSERRKLTQMMPPHTQIV